MRTFFVYLLFSIICNASGQSAADVLSRLSARLVEKKPLHFSTAYNLYRDAKAKTVFQSYTGNFQKSSENEIYMKINNTEFVNTSEISLRVNHDQKAILILKAQKFSTGDFDMSKLTQICKVTSFKDLNDCWMLTLVPNKFSGLNYDKIQVLINKNYTLRKQVFFYNTGIDLSSKYNKPDITHPRLEILYSNYSQNTPDINKLKISYFLSQSKGKKVVASSKFKSYEIIDRRSVK